ncbi:lipase family protein [Pseudoalteromonas espejiana]
MPTNLYTFGAPRVVLSNSIHSAANNIGQYRVTHGADPVPCVPAWPFSHTSNEYQTAMNEGSFLVLPHTLWKKVNLVTSIPSLHTVIMQVWKIL